MANMGQKDFDARIKRINNPRNNSYYDPDLQMHIPKKVTREKIVKPPSQSSQMLSAFLVSMVIGGVAMFCAQVFRVRYLDLISASPAVSFSDALIALWFVLLLSALMKRRSVLARMGQVAGLILMMIAGHNLIWRWPEMMSTIFTPEYVAVIQQNTQVGSIVMNGAVYALP